MFTINKDEIKIKSLKKKDTKDLSPINIQIVYISYVKKHDMLKRVVGASIDLIFQLIMTFR